VSPNRALLHLVPTGSLSSLADAAATLIDDADLTVLIRADNCFVGDGSPYGATIETSGDHTTLDVIVERCVRALEAMGATVDRDASMALIGADITFIPLTPSPAPLRFQYLMRRRHDFTHDAYLRRYHDIHSEFGVRTPNIEGYVQHHVDLERSAALAAATGLGDSACDSMSELHFSSVEHFLDGVISSPEVGREAQEDEERFVDRSSSFGFCHRVLPGRPGP
jgi:EthD domain-containing protein